ncbi:unnamed protein product [Pleuronectes platessa]|uniref:Uncharacterized protein n=1 Tax=Pleuronectes platessa TaxID=8262 RepID=A0A9N7W2V9_PLEPL|nr:unnamed protein product [Pleuronectes platessa]
MPSGMGAERGPGVKTIQSVPVPFGGQPGPRAGSPVAGSHRGGAEGQRGLPEESYLQVRFEDVVNFPQETAETIHTFLWGAPVARSPQPASYFTTSTNLYNLMKRNGSRGDSSQQAAHPPEISPPPGASAARDCGEESPVIPPGSIVLENYSVISSVVNKACEGLGSRGSDLPAEDAAVLEPRGGAEGGDRGLVLFRRIESSWPADTQTRGERPVSWMTHSVVLHYWDQETITRLSESCHGHRSPLNRGSAGGIRPTQRDSGIEPEMSFFLRSPGRQEMRDARHSSILPGECELQRKTDEISSLGTAQQKEECERKRG